MPVETVDGTDVDYFLIAYDARGDERPEGGGRLSSRLLDEVTRRRATDVVVLSHGWLGDLPGARAQYERWLTTMLTCESDRTAMRALVPDYSPVVVGLHWPSLAWGDEELSGGSFDAGAEATPEAPAPLTVDDLVERYAARLADTPAARQAIRTVIEAALEDIDPPTLPRDVRAAYEVVNAEADLAQDGEGADPGGDREPFAPEEVYQAVRDEESLEFGRAGLGGLLAPLRMLTFWQMKRRARDFGERGAHALVSALLDGNGDRRPPRVHLVGHSFGCIVASAAVAGGRQTPRPVHPVDSLVLVQGALSLWSYCSRIPTRPDRPGYFHRLLAEELVAGPVVATMSRFDRAVGAFYPLGAGLRDQIDFGGPRLPAYGGVGTWGIRGPGPRLSDLPIGGVDHGYGFTRGTVYNLESSEVIRRGDGPSGAHSDIARPEVAHVVWQAMQPTDP